MVTYEAEEDITFKINYLVQNKSRIFQLIVTEDNDTSYIPNFDFSYTLIDCKTNSNLTKGSEWKTILESNLPVLFINTSAMFEQFTQENRSLNNKEENGAALWAQGFYYVYRDRFWEENRAKLIFMVTENDVEAMWNYVNAGFTIELVPYYMKKSPASTLTIPSIPSLKETNPTLTKLPPHSNNAHI